MTTLILGKDCRNWFAELNVGMDKIQNISWNILGLYELWKQFDEKEMQGIFVAVRSIKKAF